MAVVLGSDNVPRQNNPIPPALGAPELAPEFASGTSRSADDLREAGAGHRYWRHWNERNRQAIIEYNQRIGSEGLPLTIYRSF
ncbi:MAG: type II toxin-antitoxin system CcdA family antitoxin [Burkholderiaceae bacterium]|nr:type II toxin-antitoxin system CcdA family antitoxin [Burkholderiaceae bacterium]